MKTKIDFSSYPCTNYLFRIPERYHHCTLLNFDFGGPEYEEATKNFLDNAATERKGLFISGSYGVGKTHLLVSLYRVILARVGLTDCMFQTFDDFMRLLYEKSSLVTHKDTQAYIGLFCDYEWLFLDDITTQPLHTDFPQEVIRQIINSRYERKKITCLTANGSLKTLAETKLIPQHTLSRLSEMCSEIYIEGPDKRGKRKSK